MTRFAYISDTHVGAGATGFRQQERYPEKLPEILAALCDAVLAGGDLDFILHGGDMIDATTEENILAAGRAFDLPVPVYLCLGNHDLTTPDAREQWLALAPQFFVAGAPDYTITTADCAIHVAPNHWCELPVRAHRTLVCVLGGHSHVNTRVNRDGVQYVTASSLIETTFDAKLFEITSDRIGMATIPLASSLDVDAQYNEGKAFVQGRPVDRSFSMPIISLVQV